MIRSQSEKLSFRKYMAAQCVYLCFYCLGNLGQTITKHNVSVLAVVEMIRSFRPIDQGSSQI